jgi:hypothetical protein
MDAADYQMAWVIYTIAGVVLAFLSWSFLRRYVYRELAYLLQCILLTGMFTPWYVMDDPAQRVMAPALIVFLMDSITIEPKAGIRALIPLVLALLGALVVATALIIHYRYQRKRQATLIANDAEQTG